MPDSDSHKELRDLKMLMILQLLNSGVKQKQVAAALGISEASMSRLLPKGIASSLKSKSQASEE